MKNLSHRWNLSATLWVAVAIVAVTSPLPVIAVDFRCPSSDCYCSIAGEGQYEIQCPKTDPPTLQFQMAGNIAHLRCYNIVRPHDYSILPKFSNLDASLDTFLSFNFLGCPLPDSSLKDLMSSLGVSKQPKTLYFQAYGKNLSSTLKKHHLKGLEGVSRLVLSGNSITDLPDDLFTDMKNLIYLNLRSNKVHFHSGLFKSIPQLTSLELGINDLKSLPLGMFKHSNRLKQLNLWQNNLKNLTAATFEGLNSLEELDLSANDMEELFSDAFHSIPKLRVINLDANNFSSLPAELFEANEHLRILKLSHNRQPIKILPGGMLNNLTNLKELNLDDSMIEVVEEDLLWGSENIEIILLDNNLLTTIPKDLFRDQVNLIELNLRKNKIKYIPDGAFQRLKKLKVLKLDFNYIGEISGNLFSHLTALQNFSMRYNNLSEISCDAFLAHENLTFVDLSYNNLSLMTNQEPIATDSYIDFLSDPRSPFGNLKSLKHLNLSHNILTEIFSDWKVTTLRLEELDLSYNRISKIMFNDIHFLSDNIKVDLRNNNISEIDFLLANHISTGQTNLQPNAYYSGSRPPHNVKVFIENNPINCDCTLFHFVLYLMGKLDPQVPSLVTVEPGSSKCAFPPEQKDKLLTKLRPQELLCPLDDPSTKAKHCPENCICDVRPFDESLIIDCSSNNIKFPLVLPNITVFHLNYTEFHYENSSLDNISSLGLNNGIYQQIRRLFLSGNNISRLYPTDIPKEIEILDLRNNNIGYVDSLVVDVLNESATLKELYISGNPIICDCKNYVFLSHLITKIGQVKDISTLTCSNKKSISKLKLNELCSNSPTVIAFSVGIAVFGLIIGALAALYYKYQTEIKVWLFSKGYFLWCLTERELDKDKIYDAFISYSHADEEFVVNKLVPELEGGPHPFKICLHFRDWVVGEWIPTQIARSVRDSRRTIVILSPNFLESVWGRLEFRTAHSRPLKEGGAKVIIILYGDIGPSENLDPELKAYLATNTYVKWGDPWFWNKLRYALPHPQHNRHNIPTLSVTAKKGFDDRLELIHSSTPSTPPGQNTPPAHQAHTNPLMNHVNSMPNGVKSLNNLNGSITMNGLKVNGNAKHSDV